MSTEQYRRESDTASKKARDYVRFQFRLMGLASVVLFILASVTIVTEMHKVFTVTAIILLVACAIFMAVLGSQTAGWCYLYKCLYYDQQQGHEKN
jgi:hypothetical protein